MSMQMTIGIRSDAVRAIVALCSSVVAVVPAATYIRVMTKIAVAIWLFVAASLFAQNDVDPCALIDKAALAKVFGEIKEGPKLKEGLMKEKLCEWTNMSGSWITVGVYSAEQWGIKKMSGNNPAEENGLGEEAFTDKRGTDF